MQQLRNLTQILWLQQIVIFILQILDQSWLLVNRLVFLVYRLDQYFIVLGKCFYSVFEFFLSEGKQQFVYVIYAILQIWHSDNKTVTWRE